VNDEWRTPEWVWKPWHKALGGFIIDAAATDENHLPVVKTWFKSSISGIGDAFDQDWRRHIEELGGGSVWLNPPYSKAAGPLLRWVVKALMEASRGVVVCMLLPADTSTNWFSLLWNRTAGCWKDGVQGYFTDVRVKFIHPDTGKPEGSPKFGSLIVVLSLPMTKEELRDASIDSGKTIDEVFN